jgi:hypothetical protein
MPGPTIPTRVANVLSVDALRLIVWLAKTLNISKEIFFNTLESEWQRTSASDVIAMELLRIDSDELERLDPEYAKAAFEWARAGLVGPGSEKPS